MKEITSKRKASFWIRTSLLDRKSRNLLSAKLNEKNSCHIFASRIAWAAGFCFSLFALFVLLHLRVVQLLIPLSYFNKKLHESTKCSACLSFYSLETSQLTLRVLMSSCVFCTMKQEMRN